MRTEPTFWERYWAAQPPSTTVVTMTELMERIKMQYLRLRLPTEGRCLELGSGSARLSRFLAQAGYETTGLDSSRAALRAALLWASPDDTRLADWLGCYSFAWGLKPDHALHGDA